MGHMVRGTRYARELSPNDALTLVPMNVKGHYPYEVPQGTIIKHQPCSRSFGNYLKTIKWFTVDWMVNVLCAYC